jgi:hypothetical protein
MTLLSTAIAFGLIAAVAISYFTWKLWRPAPPADAAWVASFSAEKYRPMERLLNERDYVFLAAQPGFEPSIARRLRIERRKVFRAYLDTMSRDFNALHGAAVRMALTSATDRPELVSQLIRQKTAFQFGVEAARVRLVLAGLGLGSVRTAPLLESLGSLTRLTRELRPAAVTF